jgi:hypothetical protein
MLKNDPLRLPPFHFDADPDPAFHCDADPYPAFQFDADPCGSGSATLIKTRSGKPENDDLVATTRTTGATPGPPTCRARYWYSTGTLYK